MSNKHFLKISLVFIAMGVWFYSCTKSDKSTTPIVPNYTDVYTIVGSKIYNYNNPVQLIGSNTFHVFGASGSDMNSWHLDIAREFVGNVKEEPLTGNPVLVNGASYLHSLQSVVDSNRANKRVTILCPFGWDGADSTGFTGRMPAQTFFGTILKLNYNFGLFNLKISQMFGSKFGMNPTTTTALMVLQKMSG